MNLENTLSKYTNQINNNKLYPDFFKNHQNFFKGLKLYYENKYKREKSNYKIIWQNGSTKLLDYSNQASDDNYILLIIPSLINKSYILDLKENLSMVDFLTSNRIHVYMVDWGEPTKNELKYNFLDYLNKKIKKILLLLNKIHNKKVIILGYCVGGLISLAASILFKKYISKISIIATPWQYKDSLIRNKLQYISNNFANYPKHLAISPILIKQFFVSIDPLKIFNKFINFANNQENKTEIENFVAIEQWVNDGISLAYPFLKDIINQFLSSDNNLLINNTKLNLTTIKQPVLIIMPLKDKIVPFTSSLPFIDMLQIQKTIIVDSGHIGMIVGKNAKQQLWEPLAKWILY